MGIIIWQYHSTPWTKRNLSLFLLPSFRHLYRSHSHFTLLFSFLLFFVLSSSPNEAGFVLIGSHASSFLFRSRHASRMRFRPPCIWRAVVTVVSEIILDTHGTQISVIPGAFHSPPHGLPRVSSLRSSRVLFRLATLHFVCLRMGNRVRSRWRALAKGWKVNSVRLRNRSGADDTIRSLCVLRMGVILWIVRTWEHVSKRALWSLQFMVSISTRSDHELCNFKWRKIIGYTMQYYCTMDKIAHIQLTRQYHVLLI